MKLILNKTRNNFFREGFVRSNPIEQMELAQWKFGPVVLPILLGGLVVGGISQAMATRKEGKMAEDIGKAKMAIYEEEAKGVKRQADEEAKIHEEKKIKLLAAQKAGFAAANVRLNIGAPLLVEAETRAAMDKDKGYILETGRERAESLRTQGFYEMAAGKAKRKQSKWAALAGLMTTGASAGLMGYSMGLFSGGGGGLWAGGNTTPGFGSVTHQGTMYA